VAVRRGAATSLMALWGLLIAGCGSPQPRALAVTARDFRFSPATLELTVGQPVRLTIKNPDTVEHDFQADVFPLHVGAGAHTAGMSHGTANEAPLHIHTPAGGDSFAVFTPTEKGTYAVYCTVPGHKEAGMTATIVVR
jgi:uncharacterized cupredoxin-like copper-binding protein